MASTARLALLHRTFSFCDGAPPVLPRSASRPHAARPQRLRMSLSRCSPHPTMQRSSNMDKRETIHALSSSRSPISKRIRSPGNMMNHLVLESSTSHLLKRVNRRCRSHGPGPGQRAWTMAQHCRQEGMVLERSKATKTQLG